MKKLFIYLLFLLLATPVYGADIGPVPPSDEPYNATTWNGSMRSPTQNAIRDLIETIAPSGTIPYATDTSSGVVELATDTETVIGTSTDRAVTPANLTARMAAPGSFGGTTAGTVRSLLDEDLITVSGNISANQCAGGLINNFGQTNDVAATLPSASQGMNFVTILGTTVAQYFRITAAALDKIYLDGVAGANGGYVGVVSAAAGNSLSCVVFQTGAAKYDWYCATVSGLWVAGP